MGCLWFKSITPKSIFHQKINKEFALKSGIMYAWGYNEKDPATNLVFTSKGGISDWGGILLGLQDRGILPPAETNETAEQVDANTEKAKAIVLNNQDTNLESIQESAEQ